MSRDGLGLGCIGAPGYRAHARMRSVAMARMFKGIRFGRHHFCSERVPYVPHEIYMKHYLF